MQPQCATSKRGRVQTVSYTSVFIKKKWNLSTILINYLRECITSLSFSKSPTVISFEGLLLQL